MSQTPIDIKNIHISDIAWRIIRDSQASGKKIPPAAAPYVDAMRSMTSIKEKYGFDSGQEIVLRFLGNFSTYRGPIAKEVREELKRRLRDECGYKI